MDLYTHVSRPVASALRLPHQHFHARYDGTVCSTAQTEFGFDLFFFVYLEGVWCVTADSDGWNFI